MKIINSDSTYNLVIDKKIGCIKGTIVSKIDLLISNNRPKYLKILIIV